MINYDLKKIRAVFFDVDGVLSCETIPQHPNGDPMRTVNIKDGYAMQHAVKCGLILAIITGGRTEAIRIRYESLGLKDVILGAAVKIKTYNELKEKYKQEGIMGLAPINDLMYDNTDETPWKQLAQEMEIPAGYNRSFKRRCQHNRI